MEKSKKLNTMQKVGGFLIVLSALPIFGKLLNVVDKPTQLLKNIYQLISLSGFILYLVPLYYKRLKANRNIITLFFFLCFFSLSAQNYTTQVKAFEKSFLTKEVSHLENHISPDLKFDPIPIERTPMILNNIVTNLPALNSLKIKESKAGEASVEYDFENLGISTSTIYFDDAGKITRIEFIENLIKMEMEQREKMKNSVQSPSFDELAQKHLPEKVVFTAEDGLEVNANLYKNNEDSPTILLCHQAGYNRVEYMDIAPRLKEMGFNCLAIDQRSGGNFAGKPNHTAQWAQEKKMNATMLDARQDIQAAIHFLNKKYDKKIIVWGSSYSASLALHEGAVNNNVKAIISFSPGDYFNDQVAPLAQVIPTIEIPFWISSSKSEGEQLKSMMDKIDLKNNQIHFIPESEGLHGSKVLWIGQKGAEEYWDSLKAFLNKIK